MIDIKYKKPYSFDTLSLELYDKISVHKAFDNLIFDYENLILTKMYDGTNAVEDRIFHEFQMV